MRGRSRVSVGDAAPAKQRGFLLSLAADPIVSGTIAPISCAFPGQKAQNRGRRLQERSDIFRQNLQAIRRLTGLDWKALADRCGFDAAGYKWLRRAASKGIATRRRNNGGRLLALWKALDRQLRLSQSGLEFDDLWNRDFETQCRFLRMSTPGGDQWEALVCLQNLLQTGRYDYLNRLLHDLYVREFKRGPHEE